MFYLRQPGPAEVARFIDRQSALGYNYPDLGCTAGKIPADYDYDQVEVVLGNGRPRYQRAVEDLRHWRHFDVGWVEALPASTPIEPDQTVAIRARLVGLWALAACRIIEVIDDTGEVPRFEYSFGTLPAHPEQGEERFSVRCDLDGTVSYRVTAVFRANLWVARLTWPCFRRRFNLFRRQSAELMKVGF